MLQRIVNLIIGQFDKLAVHIHPVPVPVGFDPVYMIHALDDKALFRNGSGDVFFDEIEAEAVQPKAASRRLTTINSESRYWRYVEVGRTSFQLELLKQGEAEVIDVISVSIEGNLMNVDWGGQTEVIELNHTDHTPVVELSRFVFAADWKQRFIEYDDEALVDA